MKTIYKILIFTIFCSVLYVSCNLEEDPPYLSEDSIYSSVDGAESALNGIYSAIAGFSYYGADYHHLSLMTSGLFTSGKSSDRTNVAALSPLSSQNYPTNLWRQIYVSIARANDMIANIPTDTEDEKLKNILGISYFLRAHSYFNLVRMWGGVPIHTEPANSESLHVARSSVEEVYNLIISDAEISKNLMFDLGAQQTGRPAKFAANMLLAKVYMTQAGNDNSSSYWQKAYDEAIQVYGQYSLISNYGDLWNSTNTANNNTESIFEIQFSEEAPSSLIRLFTDGAAYPGPGWKRIKPNPETIDMHMNEYPGDPRIENTFVTSFVKPNGATVKVYPARTRTSFNNGFPYLYKYWVKDNTQSSSTSNFNYVHYRYADLILMLAEIENELGQTSSAISKVNEVLARARNTGGTAQPADWSGLSQDDFREAIMKEYRFELLGEGQDWFNNRRRGYAYFKQNIIDVHNARNEKGFDIVYPDNEKTMLMPIPSDEINANRMISTSDQNPGY